MLWHGFGEATFSNTSSIWLNEAEKSLLYNISDGTWSLQYNEVIVNATSRKAYASSILGTYETLSVYLINEFERHDL